MLTCQQTLTGDACFIFVESTKRDTIYFLFQGEPQITPHPTVEPRDGTNITDPSLVSKGSATSDKDTLGVALDCLLAACPVFVGGARQLSVHR